jgi:hypothetical protein
MNFNGIFSVLFFVILIFVVGVFIRKAVKYGGIKSALFNAPIKSYLGEVSDERSGSIKVVIKVHSLAGDSTQKAIALELVAKSFASYQMMPVTLSASEAKKLSMLLLSATEDS